MATCTAATAFGAALTAEGQSEPPEETAAPPAEPPQLSFRVQQRYEPDGQNSDWYTTDFGNSRTLLRSYKPDSEPGFHICLPHDRTPIAVVDDDSAVRPKVLELLASGAVHVDTTPISVWE